MANTPKTRLSENPQLRRYSLALESIGVFYSCQNPEESCLSLVHRICRGNIKELNRKSWTWNSDWRQLRLPCPCPKTSFSAWTGPMREGEPLRKPLITSPIKNLAESSFWYVLQRLLGFFGTDCFFKKHQSFSLDYSRKGELTEMLTESTDCKS